MKVIDLTEEHKDLFYACLEDWSDEMKEAGDHKKCWCEKMNNKGLGVKLAIDENEKVGGMIQYIPVEHSIAEGNELYFINCIWVHGYKKGRGNFQKKGMGKALLQAVERDVKDRGAKGIVAWGIPFPFWMKASWYKKQGYQKVDQMGFFGAILLWKSFSEDAIPPQWIRQKKTPKTTSGKVTVTGILNGSCPAQNLTFERAKRAVAELGDKVEFEEINTFDQEVREEWGITDAVFINDKKLRSGPPPSYKKIKDKISRELRKL